ncbi:MAG: sensor histidine kinase [Chloroflexi bacterium]|nr:MAG: sensor histidine kinase [Chloroflexota bacterium]
MARELAAAPARTRASGHAWAAGPVKYTAGLVTYVAAVVVVSIVLAVVTVRVPGDSLTLSVGSAVVFLMALYAIRSLPSVPMHWTATIFLNLGLSITLGPSGAAGASLAEALGSGIRLRNGWFRMLFNLANYFLADIAAWAVFSTVAHAGGGLPAQVAAGLTAGLAQYAINYGLVALVILIANRSLSVSRVLRDQLSGLPYSVGFGVASFAFVIMHEEAGTLGFVSLLIPVVLLQGFLVVFARRVHAYEQQREAHQREREALLQRAVEASEAERRRIARDLHDGVVQNLAGMAFTLTATASQLKGQAADNADGNLADVLEQSAEETRAAMKDLRTLIIEIAPPTLRREGLHAALLEILQTLRSAGTKTRLELPSNLRLRPDRASLIFRVAQEVLRNVVAHADAKHVSVALKETDGRAVLKIIDDGKGFTNKQVARRRAEGHVGTSAIVELAEEAGGTLDIESEPGKGTRVTLSVPAE